MINKYDKPYVALSNGGTDGTAKAFAMLLNASSDFLSVLSIVIFFFCS